MTREPVALTIVTYNSARYIEACLQVALRQTHSPLEIVVVDNASHDDTPHILRRFENRIRVILNRGNVGFAAAQNQAIGEAPAAHWILTLNPDVLLSENFVSRLVEAGQIDPLIGSVCGKLLAALPDFSRPAVPLLDSTGIYFTPNLRHLDRGNRAPDQGQYERPEFVFGGTGAACLYRRTMIEDISIGGEFFDEDFFAYREDADVAWRAQLIGWKCLYTPHAVAWHVRTVTPEKRRNLSPLINMHSVKNRWLLRIKNTSADLYRRHFFSITARDIVVIGGCLFGEFSSLTAFPFVLKNFPRTWTKRREIMRRRKASDEELARWFDDQPVSFPAQLHPAVESE